MSKAPNKKKPKSKRKVNKVAIWTLVVYALIIIGLIGMTVGLVMVSKMLSEKPQIETSDFLSTESSRVYDKDGNLIADVGTQIRTNVAYDDIPESLIDAFVSIEDSRFFDHNGFDVARFAKALIENIKSGSFAQGGSTITMQLVTNTYFVDEEAGISKEKKISYKVQQIALATELEKEVDKQTIFELYLNKLNFGGSGNIRGVQKAANYYFGKSVSELNLTESAMLAGIINRPTAYNPYRYLDYATTRRNTVLSMMLRHGYINNAEYELAKSIKVEDLLVNPDTNRGSGGQEYAYQSYIDTVIEEAKVLTGQDPTMVSMDIYTYMDPNVQSVMDSIQADQVEEIEFPDDLMEVAMISIDNHTGQVVAIGGGRNYGRGGSLLLNHATAQFKQPGSSIKPIVDYALAFEYLGWATDHVVTDRPIVYAGTEKVIKNANNTYAGQITLKYAVGNSLNTPAIQTMEDVVNTVGRETVVNYLQSLGFSQVSSDNFDIGFAIGGSNFTCTAEELATAHGVLMNGGVYYQPHTISKIEFNNNTAEPLEPTYEGVQVLSEQAAYLASLLMYDAVNGPYQNYMQLLQRGYAVYGKTGTTDWGSDGLQYNIPQGAAKDKWMVSETTQYTTVVWLGYEKGVKDMNTYFDNAKSRLNLPGKISNLILSSLTDESQPGEVPQPEGISSITHILGTFPYASPIEGMDPAYVTTGLIKSENATLVDPQTTDVAELTGFTANIGGDGALNINWAPYPEPDKLVVADTTMDLSLEVGSTYLEAWGNRIFDYTWIYGPIRYKASLYSNDQYITDIVSETENFSGPVEMIPGTTMKVCGFYAYENLGNTSNEICQEFTAVDNDVQIGVPSKTTNEADVTNWASIAGFQYTINYVNNATLAGTNEITYNGAVVNDQTITVKQSALSSVVVNINIYK